MGISTFAALALAPCGWGETPAAPAPEPAKAPEKPLDVKELVKHLGGDDYAIGEIRFNRATKEVKLPGVLNMTDGLIEYVLVHEDGKTHEGLLTSPAGPFELNVALLLCGYKPDAWMFQQEGGDPPPKQILAHAAGMKTSLATVDVTWEIDGKPITKPVESLVETRDPETGKKESITAREWVFTGSYLYEGDFMAELDGSFVSLRSDKSALFNNPRRGYESDEIWFPATDNMPAEGTKVEIVIKPAVYSSKEKQSNPKS